MMRSDVGVTDFPALSRDKTCVAEPERAVLTTCFELLLSERDDFCFFVIG